ncbi:BUD14 [Candida theae]|uniref:BUD14 n=1 Tax=Candida theae TaxID=1198502 RepID=A0AAD5FXA0_9ASCO|nr:BUD14 [Candida theae]KAI5952981.1 BUD14 [Candida theae]
MSITSQLRSREKDSTSNSTTTSTTKNTSKDPNLSNSETTDFAFDQTILDDTNKILKELERKLSISSSTSSQQTNTSSVVHNNQYSGLGRQRIQSHVLSSMLHDGSSNNNNYNEYNDHEKAQRIHNSILSPNEIFQERSQYTKLTKLTSHYNDDTLVQKKGHLAKQKDRNGSINTVVRQNSLNLTKSRLESKGPHSSSYDDDNNRQQLDDFLGHVQRNDIYASDDDEEIEEQQVNGAKHDVSDKEVEEDDDDDEDGEDGYDFYFSAGNEADNDVDDDDYMDTFDEGSTSYSDDDEVNGKKQMDFHEQEYDDDDDDDDLIVPPSPPRSPPRDLDPTKLYGLYDFSGPDPSHCSLTRDEPVHLLNDDDNYWWLIKKLTKDEKIARYQETNNATIDIDSDREDGKIGFVPAECLETHGERLARLNCFKNEEMEKLVENELQLIDRSAKGSKTVKAVTFENLGDFMDSSDEEDKDIDEYDGDAHEITQNSGMDNTSTGAFTANKDEQDIRKILELYNVDLHELHPPHTQGTSSPSLLAQEQETLSEIYPTEAPLIIHKRSNGS